MELRRCLDCHALSWHPGARCRRCGGGLRLEELSALVGERLGRYQLEALIGAGGMGAVFEGRHLGLGRTVAIKLLLPDSADEAVLERFRREARTLAALDHPHVVRVLDFEEDAAGIPLLVMERLRGRTLADRIAEGGALSLAATAAWLVPIASGLAEAHRLGVVHRDLKPANIFLAEERGRIVPKLVDFGIARSAAERSAKLTRTGWVVGTPQYLSPEQMVGAEAGPASDQYSLALVVAESLSGRAVRGDRPLAQALANSRGAGELAEFLAATPLPAPCAEALARATRHEPAQRFPSILDLAAAFGPYAATVEAPPVVTGPASTVAVEAPASTSIPTPGSAAPPATRRGRRLLPLALAALGLALGAWWLAVRWPQVAPSSLRLPFAAPDFAATRKLPLPPDAGPLLGVAALPGRRFAAAFAVAGGLRLLELGDGRESFSALSPEDELLGLSRDGALLLRRGDTLLARSLVSASDTLRLRLGGPEVRALALDPDGRMALVESEGERRLLAAQVAPRSLPELAGRPLRAAVLGRRILVTLLDAPSEWLVYDQGRLRWRHPAAGYRPHQLALLEDAGQAALCGFAPEIEIIDWERERVRHLPVPVSCNAALWLPEGERLLVHAHGALLLLDPASGGIRAQPWPEATQQSRARLLASRGRILLAEPESAALHLIPLAAPLPVRRLAELSEPAWDLVSVGEEAYVAGSTGELLGLTGDSRVRSRRTHEAGISHLLPVGSFLLSASDDRSIALWDRPELELRFRSRAHEFLVNHLALGGPDAVWSASSDGELKRWRLPELLPSERIPLRDGEGRPIPLHALWIDEETGRGLAGSWNRLLIRLERRGGAWQPRIEPAPGVLYRILPLPRLEALVLLFIEPSSLALLDLRDGRLRPLPDHGRRWLGLAAGPDPERFLAAGVAALGLWRVERAPEGLAARLERFHEQAALGELSAAAAQASRRRWLLASEEAVLALSWESLGPPERAGSGEP